MTQRRPAFTFLAIPAALALACAPGELDAPSDTGEDVAELGIGWSAPRQLTNGPRNQRIQFNWGWAVDVDGAGIVHAAWLDIAQVLDPNNPAAVVAQVVYSRSLDDGATFSPAVSLIGAAAPYTGDPKVAAFGNHVYVAWVGLHDGSGVPRVYLRHSIDHGSTWDAVIPISDPGYPVGMPSVNAFGDGVHVVWYDQRAAANEIFLRSSADGGRTWTPTHQVSSNDGRTSWTPTVAAFGPEIHVAWTDERDNVDASCRPYDCGLAGDTSKCREEEYYRRSLDFGATWQPEVRITRDPPCAPASSWAPAIAAWNGTVHMTWFDRRSGGMAVFYTRSLGDGAAGTWEPDRRVSDAPGTRQLMRPSLATLGGDVHIVYWGQDALESNVYALASGNAGATFEPPRRLTAGTGHAAYHPSVALSPNGRAHAIWFDRDAAGVNQIFASRR
jgi:hypothetical protein